MTVYGVGITPGGSSAIGYGTPSHVNSSTAKLWIKENGAQGNCAKIDPNTGDYVLDEFGNSVGDDSVNQMVYLALVTKLNSSAIQGFGLDLNVTDYNMTTNILQRCKLAVKNALSHLTTKNVICVETVEVNRVNSIGIEIKVK